MSEQPKRPIGRPPRDDRGSVRVNFTGRMTGRLRDRLMALANDNGRSMSEEIERRLEASFHDDDAMRVIRETIRQEMRAEFAGRAQASLGLGDLNRLGWNLHALQQQPQTYAYNGHPGQSFDQNYMALKTEPEKA